MNLVFKNLIQKHVFFILALFLSVNVIYGNEYSVKGRVIDQKTGQALVGVNISVEGTARGVVTDLDGQFTIEVDNREFINISHIGYESQRIKVTHNDELQIILVSTAYRMDEVTVMGKQSKHSALKLDVDVKEIPLTVNIVTAKVLEERDVTDMNDAVRNINGIRPINRYGGFQTFIFRGFCDFVMMNDGVRDERHNLSTSAPQTNLANVERIEVIKGPQSVMYGHSALGGIINLIRKRPSIENKYNFSATYGSFDSKKIIAGAGGAITKSLQYRVDFGLMDRTGWRNFGQKTSSAYLALNWDASSSDNFEVQVALNDDKYDTDTGIPVDENNEIPSTVDRETRFNDPADFLIHKRYDFQVNYTKYFDKNTFLRNKMSYYFDDIDYFSTESLSYNAKKDSVKRTYPYYFNHQARPFQNQLEFSKTSKFNRMENKFLAGYSLNILRRKTYGGEIFGEGKNATIAVHNPILNQGYIDYRDTKYKAKDETSHGFYIQDWLEVLPKLKVLVGLRYDIFNGTYYTDLVNENREVTKEGEKTDIDKNAFTYRLGAVYDINDQFSTYASYSTYFKPSRSISDYGEVFDPEKGYQGELGLRYNYQDMLNINLAGYYIMKNDIVESTGKDENGSYIYEPVGEAESKGIELDINLYLNDSFTLNAGYSYNKATYLEFTNEVHSSKEGNSLRFAPENMLKIWGDWKIVKNFGVTAGLNYMDENYTNTANTYKLPAYTLVDFSAYVRFDNKELRFFVKNAFDEEYFTDAIMNNQFFPGPERNYSIMFRISN